MKRTLAILLSLVMVLSLAACAATAQEAPIAAEAAQPQPTAEPAEQVRQEETAKFAAGTYTATADGFGGPITIDVTVSAGAIEKVDVHENQETLGIGQVALEKLPAQVVEYQSIGLDAVSGATVTSTAFLALMEDCLAQAGADLEALRAPVEKTVSGEAEKLTADVVVVGAGLSGLSAAVSAGENGAKVIVLEKLAVTGGSAKASLGSYMVCQIPENEGFHVTDEPDTLEDALKRWADYQANSARVSPYPDEERLSWQLIQTMFTVDWLESYGASFVGKTPIPERGMAMLQVDVASDTTDGRPAAKVLNLLKNIALEQGAGIYTETPATELIVENNAVVGVKAEGPNGPVEVRADSVILATGGFPCNEEMCAGLISELEGLVTIASVGNTGDGITMAKAVDAALFEDAWVNPCWPSPAGEFLAVNKNTAVFQYSNSPIDGVAEPTYNRLMVNAEGERFMNEAAHYALQIVTMAKLQSGPYWSVYSGLEGTTLEIAESGLDTGVVVRGDTIEEAGRAADIDSVKLQASVDAYNAACETGVDGQFGKSADYLDKPIGEGPYYLIEIVPACSDTLGGVKTNEHLQVLREDGTVIDGLYAVGAMSNKYYYNQMYFSGSALMFSTTDGRVAGAHAAGVTDATLRPAA